MLTDGVLSRPPCAVWPCRTATMTRLHNGALLLLARPRRRRRRQQCGGSSAFWRRRHRNTPRAARASPGHRRRRRRSSRGKTRGLDPSARPPRRPCPAERAPEKVAPVVSRGRARPACTYTARLPAVTYDVGGRGSPPPARP